MVNSERWRAIGQTVAGISPLHQKHPDRGARAASRWSNWRQTRDWSLNAKGMDILRRNVDRMSSIMLDMLDYSKDRERARAWCVRRVDGGGWPPRWAARPPAETSRVGSGIRPRMSLQADGQQIYRCCSIWSTMVDVTPAGGEVWMHAERREPSRARAGAEKGQRLARRPPGRRGWSSCAGRRRSGDAPNTVL